MQALGGEQSETERDSPSCCWFTALQHDSSGQSVMAKWKLVPDVSLGQGPVKKGAGQFSQCSRAPGNPVPWRLHQWDLVRAPLPCDSCLDLGCQSGNIHHVVCQVLGAQGSPAEGSSGLSFTCLGRDRLALWGAPRAEGCLPWCSPQGQISVLRCSCLSSEQCSGVPAPMAWGLAEPGHEPQTPSRGAPVRVCSLRHCCTHPSIRDDLSGQSAEPGTV